MRKMLRNVVLLSGLVLGACTARDTEGSAEDPSKRSKPGDEGSAAAGDAAEEPKPNLPAAEDLLARHVEAAGGADKIAAIESIYTEATTDTGKQKLIGTGKIWWKQGKFYAEVSMPGVGDSTMGYDGTTVWMDDPVYHLRKLDGAQAADVIQSEGSMFPAHDWKKYYSEAKTLGSVEIDGRKYWEVELTSKDGSNVVMGFDAETGLLHHYQGKQAVPGGEMPYEAVIDEYREYGGYKFAVKHRNKVGGLIELTEVTTKLELNAPVDESKFAYPSEKDSVPADPSLQPPVTPPAPAP